MAQLRTHLDARINHLLATGPDVPPTGPETEDQARERRRRDDIYRHVEGHLGDVARLYRASQDRLRALADDVDRLMARERSLRAA
ncbi:hypothetical protein E4U42_007002 [Claviceps africana]|uniref:Uncharacterized protein n=1 Tax=Claviceps africana TaxID=83212 RepID=A0A8K0J1P4_9HYPO|nr:hypothetical protein E4U42_007002 [Claviceps africana]